MSERLVGSIEALSNTELLMLLRELEKSKRVFNPWEINFLETVCNNLYDTLTLGQRCKAIEILTKYELL
jgi:hypothetical protein